MWQRVAEQLTEAAAITALVFVMMTLVEMSSVLTRGRLARALGEGGARSLALAAALGALPGCGGAFLVVSLRAQGMASLGAVAAAMVATTGDDAFVMLATAPGLALALTGALAAVAIPLGWLLDRLVPGSAPSCCPHLEVHEIDLDRAHPEVRLWPPRIHLRPLPKRLVLVGLAAALLVAMLTGHHARHGPEAERILFTAVAVAGLLLIVFAPPHHLEEHLWGHLFRRHLPPIFAVVAGVLLLVNVAGAGWNPAGLFAGSDVALVVAAAALGLIPVSGPHLVVFLLYLDHRLPLAALVANAIVQDGHGLLPLFALTPRGAVGVKAGKLAVAIAVGLSLLAAVR